MGDPSEFSSATIASASQRVRLLCYCGQEAPLVIAWTDKNPGRRFYGCFRYKGPQDRGCGFFKWYDPEVNERVKKLIKALRNSNDAMKIREKKLVAGLVILGCVIVVLVAVLVGVIIKM